MHQRKVSIHLIQVVKSPFQPDVFTGKKTKPSATGYASEPPKDESAPLPAGCFPLHPWCGMNAKKVHVCPQTLTQNGLKI